MMKIKSIIALALAVFLLLPSAFAEAWDCLCGKTGNTGNFCGKCGRSREEALQTQIQANRSDVAAEILAIRNAEMGDYSYVYDEVGVLHTETKGAIKFTVDSLKRACGAEILVAVIQTTAGKNIAEYSLELFNTIGIGDKTKDNGFLLLLAVDDDDYYALPGKGINLELSGAIISDLLYKYLEPGFARKDYDEGVMLFFTELTKKISLIHGVKVSVEEGKAAYEAYLEMEENGPGKSKKK